MRESASLAVSTPNFSNSDTFFGAQNEAIASTAFLTLGSPRFSASACHSGE